MITAGRHWLAHLPPHHHGPMPVVLLLHGAGGNSRNVMKQSGIGEMADERGVLVIAADGTSPMPDRRPQFFANPQMWNDGSGRRTGPAYGVDDTGFLNTLLDEVAQRFRVDETRLYVMGFSNGASMALRLAAEHPDRITAVAADAGHPFVSPAKSARPVPTICVCGTADPLIPLDGGKVRLPWGTSTLQPSYTDRVAWWASEQGCDLAAATDAPAPGVARSHWRGENGAEVVLYLVAGAGHVWPGGSSAMSELIVGTDPGTFDATGVMLDFLLARSL
ncbi:MAG: alpha/beta fold hydrolase [Coriobacteriia bacterium]|nr:alpha/beta fold hydrolase [Coriobacteriia bacterium]